MTWTLKKKLKLKNLGNSLGTTWTLKIPLQDLKFRKTCTCVYERSSYEGV